MDEFRKMGNDGFNYIYEKVLKANEERIVKMPAVTANKRGVNDIGWQADNEVRLYGTLARKPKEDDTIWQEIFAGNKVNKTVSAIKIVNTSSDEECRIIIRAIFC